MRLFTLLLALFITHANAAWDDHKEDIVLAAHITGIDVALLTTVAYLESSYREDSSAAYGTSKGIMGITDPTWRHLVLTYGDQYDVVIHDRMNPFAELVMGAKYLQEIESYMTDRLGREMSYLEIYMGYKFSPHRAARMLRIDKKSTLLAFYPDAATRNKPVYFASDTPRTIMDVLNMFKGRINTAIQNYSREAAYLLSLIKIDEFKPYHLAATNSDCVDRTVKPVNVLANLTSPYDLTNPPFYSDLTDVKVSGRKHNTFFV